MQTAPVPVPTSRSPEAIVVEVLPDDERELLRAGAVLRYITRDLAKVATGSVEKADELVGHPLVRPVGSGQGGGRNDLWTMPEPLRQELIRGWEAQAAATWERISTSDDELEALYAMLASDRTRLEGLRRLEDAFNSAVNSPSTAVGWAHDLLRLLDEWPVRDDAEARALHDRLSPRLRRHSRALRDRESSEGYFERNFEPELTDLLLGESGPWMLQLHAPGGRGKSMFLKNLLGRTCPARDIPVAWIDFDHIDRLGINTTQPWRLLLTVARQLDPQLPPYTFPSLLRSFGHLRAAMHAEVQPRQKASRTIEDPLPDAELELQAAAEVPRKFRTELARAVADGLVVIAVDTVENVQHADGADLDPVLAALDEVRRGGTAKGDEGVRGLRVVVSGRFDLDGTRAGPAGTAQPRSNAFRRLLGSGPTVRPLGNAKLRVGQQAASLELPPFSDQEARRFLAKPNTAKLDPDVVEAVIGKSSGNPMKLALFTEYLERNPTTTAAEIDSFRSVELAYLVTRVVDRISSPLVQWLLRWGGLMKLLTKEAVDEIIWPALEELVERGPSYDDASSAQMPQPGPGVVRWPLPSKAEVTLPGAAAAAWEDLLTYTAGSSWVWTMADVGNAVEFHPEVRDPLRNLLRSEGNPVLDDIHRRAFDYWARTALTVSGRQRSEALRSMIFHAYEGSGGPAYGDGVWNSLLANPGVSRRDRDGLAEELLAAANRLGEADRPPASSEAVGLAHLERAEYLIYEAATSGWPVNESALSTHRRGLTDGIRRLQARRTIFLDAAMAAALGSVEQAWQLLDSALREPSPADGQALPSLELITAWAERLTPPHNALDTARLLRSAAQGTPFVMRAGHPLVRGLLAAEQWREALGAAQDAESTEMMAPALLALGRTDEVLRDQSFSAEARASAALINLDALRALVELETAAPSGASSPASPAVLLLRGQAHALRREHGAARVELSEAASGTDPVVAIEANLLLSRLLAITGDQDLSVSSLSRSLQGPDSPASLRARALDAVVNRGRDPARSAEAVHEAYKTAARIGWIPPSAQVELECARLAVLGPTVELLHDLGDALARVDGPAPRLWALQWIAEVPAAAMSIPPPLANRLRSLTEIGVAPGTAPASFLLTRAELERVLGDVDRAHPLLDALAHTDTGDEVTLTFAVADARSRLADQSTGWSSFLPEVDEPDQPGSHVGGDDAVVVEISSAEGGEVLVVERTSDDAAPHRDAGGTTISTDVLFDGLYALAFNPDGVFEALGAGLAGSNVQQRLQRMPTPVLALEIRDDAAARWPWELARLDGHRLLESISPGGTMVRTGRSFRMRGQGDRVFSPQVYLAVLNERKDRGDLAGLLQDLYGRTAQPVLSRPYDLIEKGLAGPQSEARLLHLVATPVERRRAPALQLSSEDHLTPERLARALDRPGPTLLILDLVLPSSDSEAAEQLLLANAFCWHVVRNANDLSVLCGTFGGGNDRFEHLELLVDGLREGRPLGELVGDLQRQRAMFPWEGRPLRECVSLTTDAVHRRFQLGKG